MMAEDTSVTDAPFQIDLGAADPASAAKGGVMLMLGAQGYERLKAIIKGADVVIDRMLREGKIKRMVLPY